MQSVASWSKQHYVGFNMSLEMFFSDFEKSSSEIVSGTVTYVEYFLVTMVVT